MKNLIIINAITAAMVLTSTTGYANSIEECVITDKAGKNLIKANKADCGVKGKHDCGTGQNVAGAPDAFIKVPKGQCEKIKAAVKSGDFCTLDKKTRIELKKKLDIKIDDKKCP